MTPRPWLLVSLVALFGVLLLGAFPVRGYLDQQRQREELAASLQALTAENQRLVDQVAWLKADDTVERLARDRYHMVRPGEEAYAILPEAAVSSVVPASPPAAPVEVDMSWLRRAWSRITSIL